MRAVRRAFTLVELLVVVGIIAVLVSMLLPALNRAREQAKTTQCLAQLQQMALAVKLYANANQSNLPIAYSNNQPTDWPSLLQYHIGTGSAKGNHTWNDDTGKPLKVSKIFLCPSAIIPNYLSTPPAGREVRNTYSTHPRLIPRVEWIAGSGSPPYSNGDPYYSKQRPMKTKKEGTFKRSAELMLIWDGVQCLAEPSSFDQGNSEYAGSGIENGRFGSYTKSLVINSTDNLGAPAIIGANKDVQQNGDPGWARFRYRHGRNDTICTLYADYHAGTMRMGEIQLRNFLMEKP